MRKRLKKKLYKKLTRLGVKILDKEMMHKQLFRMHLNDVAREIDNQFFLSLKIRSIGMNNEKT